MAPRETLPRAMTDNFLLPAEFAGLDLLATMVVVASAEGECLFANAAFENVMRLSRRTVQKAQLPDWFDDPQRLTETLAGVAANHYSSSRFDALLRRGVRPHEVLVPVHVIVSQLEAPFFGVSKLSWNATLAYEKGPVGARLSYVRRSAFLAANEAALFANPIGIWRQPEKSVDLQLTYNLNDRMAFDISGVNLTNEMQQQYYKFGDAGSPELTNFGTVQTGRALSVGFRWKL